MSLRDLAAELEAERVIRKPAGRRERPADPPNHAMWTDAPNEALEASVSLAAPSDKRIFRDVFNYFEKYKNIKTDEDWCSAAAELGALCGELNNDPFAMELLQTVYNEFERRYQQRSRRE